MLPPVSLRTALWIGGAAVALILSGVIADRLSPATVTHTETRTKAQSQDRTETQTDTRVLEAINTLATQNAQLEQRLQASERRQADVQTRTVERIERFTPAAPAGSPVVVLPGQPAPPTPAAVVSRDPVEIVTRTIEAIDRTRTERDTDSETRSATTATASATSTTETTAKTEVTSESKSSAETETKTETRVAQEPERRLGVGVTSAAQPFASYDLTSARLGPRALGIGKVGAGLFVTRGSSGVDGGPQVNVTPGKGRIFIGAGYAVKSQQSLLMLGMKF